MIHQTAKVSEQVNRKCPPRNTILQFSTPNTDHITPHHLNHRRCCHLADTLTQYCTQAKCHNFLSTWPRPLAVKSWFQRQTKLFGSHVGWSINRYKHVIYSLNLLRHTWHWTLYMQSTCNKAPWFWHSFQLPGHSTHLSDCNFLTRMLYNNCYFCFWLFSLSFLLLFVFCVM